MVTPLGGRLRQKTFSQRAAGSGAVDHAALSGIATSMNLHLFGGCLIDPATGTDTQADLFISEGQIAGIGAPGRARFSSVESELAAALAGGVTHLVCPPDTDPPLDDPARVEMLRTRAG